MNFSSRWARAWDDHEVVNLAVGRLALSDAEENPDEVVVLDHKTEAVIRELKAQHGYLRHAILRCNLMVDRRDLTHTLK